LIYSKPSVSFEAAASGFDTGLTGTLAVRVTDGQTGTSIARTTVGITEFPNGSGIYGVTLTAPSDTGQYQVVWDDGTNWASEELTVTFTGSVYVVPASVGGGMALSVMLTEFYARGFDYLNDGAAGEVRATRWLNQAYLDICEMDDWPFLETSVSGTAPFTFTDLSVIESIKNSTNSQNVRFVDYRTLREQFANLDDTGTARYAYMRNGDTLCTYPVSTDTITVKYFRVVGELVASTDMPLIPARYQYAIIDYACARAYMDSDNPEAAAAARRDGEALVTMMRDRLLFPQRQDAEEITVYGYSTDERF
jgi:hypothetical protein